jgi:kinesin family protein 5
MGLIPRMILSIFDEISNSDPYIEYTIKVSYCEIYLEKIRDLLDTTKTNLKIHEDRARGVYIGELTEKYVAESEEVMNLMKQGLENRVIGSTNMNQQSSRSHSIFSLTINQMNNRDFISRTGKLYLIDLAGSEKVAKTSSAGLRLEEAKNINKSLTLLGLVIYSLTDGKSTHIPYRDSKLTRVLKDSIGGNSKTALIITCSPSKVNESETISTLRFGLRTKKIKNKPKINKDFSVAELKIMLSKCREELDKKDKQIKEMQENIASSSNRPSLESRDFKDEGPTSPGLDSTKIYGYEDILAELEDTKNKLAQEVKNNEKLRIELALQDEQLRQRAAVSHVSEEKNLELKRKILEYEKVIQEQAESIEKAAVTRETLEKEVKFTNNRMFQIERNLIEQQIIAEKHSNPSLRAGFEELKDLLSKEKEENSSKTKEIEELRKNLNHVIQKRGGDFTIQEVMRQDIARQESEKWSDEKKRLLKELQTRIDRIIELELALDDFKQAYWKLEDLLSDGEKALKRKTDTLERNLEQLTLMYHQLVMQKSTISAEKTLAEKKLARVSDTIKNLQEELQKSRDLLEKSEENCKILAQQAETFQGRGEQRKASGNCVKFIQGGKKRSNSNSFNFKV